MQALFWINDGGYNKDCLKVATSLGAQDICIQLAEECSELAQASLKVARNIGRVNKSRKPHNKSLKDLKEEIGDVLNCLNVMQIEPNSDLMKQKMKRWVSQLAETKACTEEE